MKESVKAGLRPGWMRSRLDLALSPLVGIAGSSGSGVLDESVFVSAMMILAWMIDPSDLIEWTWVVRREPWFYLRLSSGWPDTSSGSAGGP